MYYPHQPVRLLDRNYFKILMAATNVLTFLYWPCQQCECVPEISTPLHMLFNVVVINTVLKSEKVESQGFYFKVLLHRKELSATKESVEWMRCFEMKANLTKLGAIWWETPTGGVDRYEGGWTDWTRFFYYTFVKRYECRMVTSHYWLIYTGPPPKKTPPFSQNWKIFLIY